VPGAATRPPATRAFAPRSAKHPPPRHSVRPGTTTTRRHGLTPSSGRFAFTRMRARSSPTARARWRRNGTCLRPRSIRLWMRWARLSAVPGRLHRRLRHRCQRRRPVRLSRATARAYTFSFAQTNKRQTKARIESGPTNSNKQIKQSNRSNKQNRQAAAFLALSHDDLFSVGFPLKRNAFSVASKNS
jgi:hypothetical protein